MEDMTKKKGQMTDNEIRGAVESTLLGQRYLFLSGEIEEGMANDLIKQMFYLNLSDNTKPIFLWINSGGGSCDAGIAIVNTMHTIECPVVTIINNIAASMAGYISICGDQRIMYRSAFWMSHDMAGGIDGDYTDKVIDRAAFLKRYRDQMDKILRKRTKLTKQDLQKAHSGELWLDAETALNKQVVDKIVG